MSTTAVHHFLRSLLVDPRIPIDTTYRSRLLDYLLVCALHAKPIELGKAVLQLVEDDGELPATLHTMKTIRTSKRANQKRSFASSRTGYTKERRQTAKRTKPPRPSKVTTKTRRRAHRRPRHVLSIQLTVELSRPPPPPPPGQPYEI